MKGILLKAILKEMENIYIKMAIIIQVNGNQIKLMGKEKYMIKMEILYMREILIKALTIQVILEMVKDK